MTNLIPAVVYILCLATCITCAALLGRSYRRSGAGLLFWSATCFSLLAINNLTVVVDLLLVESIDFRVPRAFFNLAAVATLMFGFIWNGEE